MTEHVTHLETLRDEITIMTERKLDLERRIEALYSERDGLSTTLDESADRIVMNEMEISDSEKSLNGSRRPFSNIEEDVDDIECDNPECPEEVQELKQEILSAFQQLKNMCSLLRQRGSGGKQRRNSTDSLETTSSSEEPRASQVRVGLLHEVMQELKGLLHDILRKEAKGSCPA